MADLLPKPERFQNLTDFHILQSPEFQSGGPSKDHRVKSLVSMVQKLGLHTETVQYVIEQIFPAAKHRPDDLAGEWVYPFPDIARQIQPRRERFNGLILQ